MALATAIPRSPAPGRANLAPNPSPDPLSPTYNPCRRQPTLSPATSQQGRIDGWQPQPYQVNPRQSPVASEQLCSGVPPPAGGAAAGGTRGVSFQVQAETRWGDTVVLVGSAPQLGLWDPARGLPLLTDAASYPLWRLPAAQSLAVGEVCEFKFVIMRAAHDGQPSSVEWEELQDNRRLQLGAEAPAELRLEMIWGTPRTLAWRRTCAPPYVELRGNGASGER